MPINWRTLPPDERGRAAAQVRQWWRWRKNQLIDALFECHYRVMTARYNDMRRLTAPRRRRSPRPPPRFPNMRLAPSNQSAPAA